MVVVRLDQDGGGNLACQAVAKLPAPAAFRGGEEKDGMLYLGALDELLRGGADLAVAVQQFVLRDVNGKGA